MKQKLVKSLGVFILAVCMLVAGSPVPAFATEINEAAVDEGIEDASKTESEIPEDAIYISTEEDLIALAENCRVDAWSAGKVVVLNNDIEFSGTEFQGIPTFGGVFLGQGHTIKGLYLDGEGSVVGFFRYLQKTAVVINLNIEGQVIPEGSKCAVGGFVGENAGYIINCSFTGTVAGAEQIGGIVGNNRTTGVLQNCYVHGTVYGNHFIGGIVGENHGVVRNCENNAEINTESVQNKIAIEDITMESLISTEVSNTSTDIGGVVGVNSGVIRGSYNKGAVGYNNMGFNVGGIAGSQKGYIVDCTNYADVQGRKEVGGIVGQMEPNILLDYDRDSLQMLSSQMNSIENSLNSIKTDIENSDLENQMNDLEGDFQNVQDAIDALYNTTEMPEIDNWEDFEDVENWNPEQDQNTAARNDLSNALDNVYKKSENIANSASDTSREVLDKMSSIVSKLGDVVNTVGTADVNLGYSMEDVSAHDTLEDTIGKVANCENYGKVKGDMNIGGIAGIIAKENDLDEYQDTTVTGEESLNATYEIRAVIRSCKNHATITANKQNAGGIVGQMVMGAIFENINLGNMDALNADYVGGIAGNSATLIKDCGSRAIISGDTYVGGVAGKGNEVTGCYAFTDIKAFTEKGGAVLGFTEDIPSTEDTLVSENYYVVVGDDIGGIDGISYVGASDKLSIEEFLAKEDIAEEFHTVKIRFEVKGQNSVVLTVNVGENVSMEQVPKLSTENATEYAWEVVPAVTSEMLDMGETAKVEYLSEEALKNVLFDQTYEAVFDAKGTVVRGNEKNANNLAVILAEGVFARDTKIEMQDILSDVGKVDNKTPIVSWQVTLSNTGVDALHYLIPEDVDMKKVKLFVKDASDTWIEREFVQEASYIVFDFMDEDIAFALVDDYVAIAMDIFKLVAIVAVVVVAIVIARKVIKKKKNK